MLVIKDIEIIDCKEDKIELIEREPIPSFPYDLDPPERAKVKTEMVIGKRFRNSYNQEVCIGMSKKVQNALGLPLEAFRDQENLIYKQSKE